MTPTPRERGRRLQRRRQRHLSLHPLCDRCQKAGSITAGTQVDHRIPLFKGGEDDFETNGQTLCDDCHKDKTADDLGHARRRAIGLDGFPLDESQ